MSERTGILVFPDGTQVRWEFVEHLPRDPAAYQDTEGIIVRVPSYPGAETGNDYFICLGTGAVFAADETTGSLIRGLEGVYDPEIMRNVEEWEAIMSRFEEVG